MELVHFRLLITGRVQGVGFRKNAVEQAIQLDLRGFAMNLQDGSVLIEVEGERSAVERFVLWCRRGPALARVDNLRIETGPLVGHSGFATRR
ncbi:MAG TPA: acylphosphatase [Flavobacteriales bacterium]